MNDKITVETYEPFVSGMMRCVICGADHSLEEAMSSKKYFSDVFGYTCEACYDGMRVDDDDFEDDYEEDY